MCGIAGIYAYRDPAPSVDRDELLRIREAMTRRGPDGAGLWISEDQRIGLAHRRLAIIDLSASGAQPMATTDGRLRITFNGEIYNYRELRKELEAKGYAFQSNSDTEVLLHLYADRGEEMVHALRGMYAFAIWDDSGRSMFLARDPFGIKPLYYADDGKTFRFASQVKALLSGGALDTAPEPAGVVGFLLLGSVPEPCTTYASIRALPAGAAMSVRSGAVGGPRSFFDVRDALVRAQDSPVDPARGQEIFRDAILGSVNAHLVADVPVGVFLSAGIDSGAITALAAEAGARDLRTLTVGFREFGGTPDDEVPLARAMAERYGTTHRTEWVSRDDFERVLPDILEAMDQPSIDGVNTYLVSRAAAANGMKVVLSGLGGDELLGGYPSFRQIPRLVRALGWTRNFQSMSRGVRKVTRPALSHLTSPKYAGLLEYGGSVAGAYLLRRSLFMPWELDDLLQPSAVRTGLEQLDLMARLEATTEGLGTAHAQVTALELAWYMRNQLLRDADWAGMAHSVEIRVPLVDVALFRALAPAITRAQGPTKAALAGVPKLPVMPGVVHRPKTGFSTPVRDWIDAPHVGKHRGLRGWARQVIAAQPAKVQSVVAPGSLRWSGPTNFPSSSAYRPEFSRVHRAQAGALRAAYWTVNNFLRSMAWLFWPRTRPLAAQRIVVFRIGHVGDTTCALPAIHAVRHAYPTAHLTLLTSTGRGKSPGAEELLAGAEWIDEILAYGNDDIATLPGRWKLAMTLRGRRFDVWINLSADNTSLHRELRDMAFVRLVGPHWARGWCVDALHFAPQAQSEFLNFPNEVERVLAITARMGIPTVQTEFGLPRTAAVKARVDALLPPGSVGGWVALAPGAKRSTNRWPTERFAAVGSFLATRGVGIVMIGGAADSQECALIADRIGPGALSLAGRLTLPESCEALRRCRLAVCVDSGVQHLAAAVGTPCLSLLSFRDIRGKWHPCGAPSVVLQKWVPCHTCLLEECPNGLLCMTAIQVDEVLQHAAAMLERRLECSSC